MSEPSNDIRSIRADAEALAASLPDLLAQTQAGATLHVGSAGRRKAGTGEHFWQYRRYGREDAADRIDWRRSAKGTRLYVKETELETARTYLFWSDDAAGFQWRSTDAVPRKSDRANTIMLAIAILLAKSGERCGVMGGRPPSIGNRTADRMYEDMLSPDGQIGFPPPPSQPASLVLASDFYDGVEVWRDRLGGRAQALREGVLLYISDPAETEFPYSGRVQFNRPGLATTRTFGRAERIRDAYLERRSQHEADLVDLAQQLGWRIVKHVTTDDPLIATADVHSALQSFGATT